MQTTNYKRMPEDLPDALSAKAREARNKYMREYRRTHAEQIRANNARYWERKAMTDETETE